MNKRKISFITIILIIPFIILLGFYLSNNNNIINKIMYYNENDSIEEDYEIQQVSLFAINLKVKGEYDEKIKSTPLTCNINVDRMTRLIYMDGEKELGDKYISYKKPAGELMQPTKKGYIFVQWTNKDGELIDENSIIDSTVDYRIYANWNIIVSELTVDPNGGTWNENLGTQSFSMEYATEKEIEDPSRVGYTFSHWSVTGADSTIEEKIFTMGTEDALLQAIYTANKYTLTVDPNGGIYNGTTNPTKITVDYDSVTTIPKPTRVGYTFTGWTVSNGELNDEKFVMNYPGDVTLTANWTINNYKYIVYHNQQSIDGTSYNKVANDTEKGTQQYGTVISPNVKTYTGFTSPSRSSLTIQDDVDPPVKNILNYNYTRNKYTLTINPNSGKWNGLTTNSSLSLYYEQTYSVANPTRTGYNFTSWTKSTSDSTLTDKVFKMGLTNTTLTANWSAKTYTLTYNVNGGNALSTTSKTITYNASYGTLPTPTRTGYTFLGWYTTASGGTKVTSSTVHTQDANVTIYAHWSNTPPKVSITKIQYTNSGITSNGILQSGYEIATITVSATDVEDGTPTVTLTCTSGRLCSSVSITKKSEGNGQAVFTVRATDMGVGLIEVKARDKGNLTATDHSVLYVYGPGASTLVNASYTNTTFDSGWLDVLEGCYISNFTFNVQFASGHYNSSNNDTMVVYGMTESGRQVVLYTWTGNMDSALHSSTLDILNAQTERIRQIRFYTYSPHDGCTPSAKITYSVVYSFDINLLNSTYRPV